MAERIWEVGRYQKFFNSGQLPLVKNVLQVLFYYSRKERKTVTESSTLVAKQLHLIAQGLNIQTQRIFHIGKKIRDLHGVWRKLLKSRKKNGIPYEVKRTEWRNKIKHIFDITYQGGTPCSGNIERKSAVNLNGKISRLHNIRMNFYNYFFCNIRFR